MKYFVIMQNIRRGLNCHVTRFNGIFVTDHKSTQEVVAVKKARIGFATLYPKVNAETIEDRYRISTLFFHPAIVSLFLFFSLFLFTFKLFSQENWFSFFLIIYRISKVGSKLFQSSFVIITKFSLHVKMLEKMIILIIN